MSAATNNQSESSFSIINALSILIISGYTVAMPMWMWWPPVGVPPEILAIINQMMGAWGMAFGTVIAFHLGSSRSSKDAASATRETIQTLSNGITAALPTAPVAPVVAAWWTKLTDAEKTTITAAVPADPRVAAFVSAATVGSATADDLVYLVSKNLLTKERADAIQATAVPPG